MSSRGFFRAASDIDSGSSLSSEVRSITSAGDFVCLSQLFTAAGIDPEAGPGVGITMTGWRSCVGAIGGTGVGTGNAIGACGIGAIGELCWDRGRPIRLACCMLACWGIIDLAEGAGGADIGG